VREELAIEHLIARKDAEAAHEERRRDQARMDELGLRAGGHP
jgi:flagellar biosynthesis chaperone FliJ